MKGMYKIMAKEKNTNINSAFQNFRDLCKKIAKFNNFMIKLPNNVILLDHQNTDSFYLPSENFIYWKDLSSGQFFNWCILDPNYLNTILKEKNIKVKGTELIDNNDSINILKDGELITKIEKLRRSSLEDDQFSPEYLKLLTKYKKIPNIIHSFNSLDFIKIDETDKNKLITGDHITLVLESSGKENVQLARSLFPLLSKKSTIDIEYSILEKDLEKSKTYIIFKEVYDTFDLYSILAFISINK